MNSCAQLRRDLRDAIAERERELDMARRRFWLGLLGLDFILDWEDRGSVDRAVSGFLALVQAGQIVLALQELVALLTRIAAAGRPAATRMMAVASRRLLGTVALTLVVLDVIAGYTRWEREEVNIERRFRARVRELHQETRCRNVAEVFREEGVSLP